MYLILLIFIILVCLVIWVFLRKDHGAKEPTTALWNAVLFGSIAIILSVIIELFLFGVPSSGTIVKGTLISILLQSITVGIVEETAKYLPLSLWIFKKKYFNEHTDGIIYFAICGLSFGLIENILYTFSGGSSVGILRIILTPLFHGATTASIGFFLSNAKLNNKGSANALWALAIAALLHGIYNFGLLSGTPYFIVISLMITIVLDLAIFLFYMKANELDKAEGLSAIGNNAYCRSCGKHNINHTLYCEYCGKKT